MANDEANIALLSRLYANAPIATAICTASGEVVDANRAMCRMLGYSREELLKKNVTELTHPDDVADVIACRGQLFTGELTALETEKRYLHKAGHCIWTLVSIWAIAGASDQPRYTIGQIVSLDKEKQMEQQLLLAYQQRDTLVREVHHRIKNNLQSVTGLLHRQQLAHPEIANALAAAIGQVEVIAVMHGLQSAAHKGHLRVCEMLDEIVTASNQLYGDKHAITIDNQMPGPLLIANDETVPLALVLNELITNAVKHCQGDGAQARVTLQRPHADTAMVTIVNRARPLADNFDFATGVGCGKGLQLVRALLPRAGTTVRFNQSDAATGLPITTVQVLIEPPVIYMQKPGTEQTHIGAHEPL